MRDDILGGEGDALLRADDGFELRLSGLELFLTHDLLALGRFLELGVDVGFLAFGRLPFWRELRMLLDLKSEPSGLVIVYKRYCTAPPANAPRKPAPFSRQVLGMIWVSTSGRSLP
jgi:hypothetical protein